MTKIRISKTGKWTRAGADLSRASSGFKAAVKQALIQEGENLANKMRGTIRAGIPPAHSPLTLVIRRAAGRGGGSKVLIQTGRMINQITVVPSGFGIFVGLKAGSPSANIGAIHEFGASWTQRMTPRQRKFLFAMLRKAGRPANPKGASTGGQQVKIRIPARPFIGPTAEKFGGSSFQARFNRRLGRLLRGALGS
jgi:phage gpG-like protein